TLGNANSAVVLVTSLESRIAVRVSPLHAAVAKVTLTEQSETRTTKTPRPRTRPRRSKNWSNAVTGVALGMVIAFGTTNPAQPAPLAPAPGAKIADFTLPDVHRRSRSLQTFKDKKAFVVVFLGTECPVANLYVPTLVAMHEEYAAKGVQFLAINANPQDRFVSVSAHAQERNLPFQVLKDFDQRVAEAFGAKRTPEAFLLDAKRVIRYHGRIDDQYGVGFQREKPTRRDLQEAIDELLAGKPITTPATEISGCLITRLKKPLVEGQVTYAK